MPPIRVIVQIIVSAYPDYHAYSSEDIALSLQSGESAGIPE